jgi:hypothetical protein
MRWAGHVHVWRRGSCSVLVVKPEGKKSLERPQRRWENNIKIDLQEVGWGVAWAGLIWLRIGTGGGPFKWGNEGSDSVKCWEFLD